MDVDAGDGSGVSGTPQVGSGEVEHSTAPSPVPYRRSRGIRLNELDRSRQWVIGFTGRRWEVVGCLQPPGSVVPASAQGDPGRATGAEREAPSTSAGAGPLDVGRHAARTPAGALAHQFG